MYKGEDWFKESVKRSECWMVEREERIGEWDCALHVTMLKR
jgi:hypothetical protein